MSVAETKTAGVLIHVPVSDIQGELEVRKFASHGELDAAASALLEEDLTRAGFMLSGDWRADFRRLSVADEATVNLLAQTITLPVATPADSA